MKQIESLESKTIECLRLTLSISVVLLHSYYLEVLSCGEGRFLSNFLSAGICRVAVPTFFLMSGYLFFKGFDEWNWSKWTYKLRRRITTLLIPYFLWNIIALFAQFIRMSLKGIPYTVKGYLSDYGWLRIFWDKNQVGGSSYTNILGYEIPVGGLPMDNALWFVRDLMVVCIAAPLVYLYVRKTGVKGLVVLALLSLFSIWIPMSGFSSAAFLFFSIGAYISLKGKGLVQTSVEYGKVSITISGVLLICVLISNYYFTSLYSYLCTLFTISGSLATIYIISKLAQSEKIKIYPEFGPISFFIFALHAATLLSFVGMVVTKFISPESCIGYYFDYFIITVMTTLICLFLYFLLKKICPQLLSLLVGGRI